MQLFADRSNWGEVTVLDGLPQDAELVRVGCMEDQLAFYAIFKADSFKEVHEGEVIPIFSPTLQRATK